MVTTNEGDQQGQANGGVYSDLAAYSSGTSNPQGEGVSLHRCGRRHPSGRIVLHVTEVITRSDDGLYRGRIARPDQRQRTFNGCPAVKFGAVVSRSWQRCGLCGERCHKRFGSWVGDGSTLLDKLRTEGVEKIALDQGYYWKVFEDEMFLMNATPENLGVGDLAFDLDNVGAALELDNDAPPLLLVGLASLLSYVGLRAGDQLYPGIQGQGN
jgi:hypothetical protein